MQGSDQQLTQTSNVTDMLQMRADQIQAGISQIDKRLRQVCQERPFTVLASAIAAGFLVGRIVARR